MSTKYYTIFMVIASLLLFGNVTARAQEAQPDSTSEMEKLAINSEDLDILKSLPGLTPELAEEIVKGRPYTKIEDLLEVKGMDEETLTKLKEFIEIDKLNVNFATSEALQALPGITPQLAEAIIKGRPYVSMEDLLKVEGMSKEAFAKFQAYVEATLEKKEQDETRGRKSNLRKLPLGTKK